MLSSLLFAELIFNPFPELFFLSYRTETVPTWQELPFSPPLRPWQPPFYFPSYECDYSEYFLSVESCPISPFAPGLVPLYRSVLKAHPHCSLFRFFIPCHRRMIFHCTCVPHFAYPRTCSRTLPGFHPLAVGNSATMSMSVFHVDLRLCLFSPICLLFL